MTSNEQAIRLWVRGVSVIPIPRPPAGDGKRPKIAWREYQMRQPYHAEIRRWFSGEAVNYAVITGKVSGIVVVDADEPAAIEWVARSLPFTPWQVQTSKGRHYYYRHPGCDVGNRARVEGIKLDLRGDGGYVVGPGSLHASGVTYEPIGDWRRPRGGVPQFDPVLVARAPAPPAEKPRHKADGENAERARRYLSRIPPPIIGHGSDAATFDAACKVGRGFALSEDDAIALLCEWSGFDAWWVSTKVRAAFAYGDEPIGGRLYRAG